MEELKEQMHVKHTNHNGRISRNSIAARLHLEFVGCYKDLLRIMHGNLIEEGQILKGMMIQVQTHPQ